MALGDAPPLLLTDEEGLAVAVPTGARAERDAVTQPLTVLDAVPVLLPTAACRDTVGLAVRRDTVALPVPDAVTASAGAERDAVAAPVTVRVPVAAGEAVTVRVPVAALLIVAAAL